MADALTDLNQMIERIRREALAEGHAAGYALAMAKVAAFAMDERPDPEWAKPKAAPQEAARAPRGKNRDLVLDAMAALPGAASVKAIQDHLEGRGHSIPYSSIQAAMAQLTRDEAVELVGRGEWRLKTNTASDAEAREAVLNALIAFD
jgi:hypothetical protein